MDMPMGIISEILIIDTLFILILLIGLLYYYSIKTFNHYAILNVKFIKPLPVFGNMIEMGMGRKTYGLVLKDLYDESKCEQVIGIFVNRSPFLMIRDPELIHRVLIKDFSHFFDRGTTADVKMDPLQANLLNLEGHHWKLLRKTLMPAFSFGKLKSMIDKFSVCADRLINQLDELTKNNNSIEIQKEMMNLTTDVIGSYIFGLKFSLFKNPDSEFRKVVREIFKSSFRSKLRMFFGIIDDNLPSKLGLTMFAPEIESFFMKLIKDTINYREENKIKRNDFIQILMDLRKRDSAPSNFDNDQNEILLERNNDNESTDGTQDSQSLVLDDKRMVANTFVFLLAGFETTGSTLIFCFYELAKDMYIQNKLRKEINDIVINKYENEICEGAIKRMTYMERVVAETIRKYSVITSVTRKCTKPYSIPGTSIHLKTGEKIIIPVYAIHHDPKYYPFPEKFDPERFTEENKAQRPTCTYMPFGDGPHICIGAKFSIFLIKVVLTKIISQYIVTLNQKTELPLRFKARNLLLTPDQKVWLDLQPITTILN